MILQRLASALRRQDWFQVLIEILIVVIGIFLGLQVQAWYDGRDAQQEEQLVVGYMVSDIEKTLDYLIDMDALAENQIVKGYIFLTLLEAEELSQEDAVNFEEAISIIGKMSDLTAFINSFGEENLTKILNIQLRQKINEYVGDINRLTRVSTNIQSKVDNVMPFVMRKSMIITRQGRDRVVIYDFETLKNDPEYKASYAAVLDRIITYQGRIDFLNDKSKNLLQALKNYQSGKPLEEQTP